ncbi:hypothetical protein ACS0TY_021095 [Phlomoides rotata]
MLSNIPSLIFLIHLAFPSLVGSQNFSFPSFDSSSCENGSNIICLGSVKAENGSLNITPDGTKEASEVGRVLFRFPVHVWPSSFSTAFTIRITSNSSVSGDGMAFVIAQDSSPSPPQSYGSYIGIMDPSTEGGALRQLAVEFDTYKNPRDIDRNHIAIDITSVEYPVAVRSLTDTDIDLKSGREIMIRIEYDGWGHNLEIYVAYAGERMVKFLTHKIIMQETVHRLSYVGFTGSTGHVSELHQILDWNFTLYELPEESLDHGNSLNKCKKLVLILVPTSVVLVAVCVVLFLVRRRRRKAVHQRRDDMEMLTKNAANAPKFYTYKLLSKATHNFSKENLLGTGGFGSVYKGVVSKNSDLPNVIAVKKINATSSQDSNYTAHLGDFGLARLLQNNVFITTMVAGTIGYLAPEVSYTGRATPESDIYSFGMVVLEVICGRRSKGIMEEHSIVDSVWSLYEKGSLLSCVDRTLKGEYDNEQVKRSLVVGLACLNPDQMHRPKMRKVVQIFLNCDEPLMKLPPSRPTELCLSLPSSSPENTTTDFPDEITMQYDSSSYTK